MQKLKSGMPVMLIAGLIALVSAARSQSPAVPQELQEKIQAMQKAGAGNARRLQEYQWIETTTVALNGSARPAQQFICRYTPYGTLVKTPMGPPPAPPSVSGGPLRRHIAEKKIEGVQQELAAVRELTARYLPLSREAMQQALRTRRVDLEHDGVRGTSIVINDYAKPGDKLILSLNLSTMQIRAIRVESYLGSPSDGMSASVEFAMLADGTSYPNITTISAPGKHISITTIESNFSRPVQ